MKGSQLERLLHKEVNWEWGEGCTLYTALSQDALHGADTPDTARERCTLPQHSVCDNQQGSGVFLKA